MNDCGNGLLLCPTCHTYFDMKPIPAITIDEKCIVRVHKNIADDDQYASIKNKIVFSYMDIYIILLYTTSANDLHFVLIFPVMCDYSDVTINMFTVLELKTQVKQVISIIFMSRQFHHRLHAWM